MVDIVLNPIQTLAVAVLAYYVGSFVVNNTSFFKRFSIPAPVVGGVIFAFINLFGHVSQAFSFHFDISFQNFFMTIFFTSVGFAVNTRILTKYSKRAIRFTFILLTVITMQNVIGVGLSKAFGIDGLFGLLTGSASMVGGHGTAAALSPGFEERFGLSNAGTIALASATFGLISGGIIGGPVASLIAKRGNLSTEPIKSRQEIDEIKLDELSDKDLETSKLLDSSLIIFFAMGLGTIMQTLIEKTGVTFPNYVGAMVVAVIIRNIAEHTEKIDVHLDEIEALGQICLTIFVSMALISIKLWELVGLALPMFAILLAQVLFIAAFMYFIGFHILGSDYDACVMVSGVCGFALGAMSNAVTNMNAFTKEWGDSPLAMVIVPGVGSVFIDFFNIGILMVFINLLA